MRQTTNMSDLSNADFVIEAATENESIKKSIFEQLNEITASDVILGIVFVFF